METAGDFHLSVTSGTIITKKPDITPKVPAEGICAYLKRLRTLKILSRAMLYQAMKAQTLEEAIKGIEIIAGAKNVAEVRGMLAEEEKKR